MTYKDKILLLYVDYAVRVVAAELYPALNKFAPIRNINSLDVVYAELNSVRYLYDPVWPARGVCERARGYITTRLNTDHYFRYCILKMNEKYGYNAANFRRLLAIAIDPDQYW